MIEHLAVGAAFGFLIGATVMDLGWRYVNRLRDRVEKTRLKQLR